MINSVSTATSTGTTPSIVRAMDKVSQEQLYSPGLYSMPELMEYEHHHHKRDAGFLGFLGKVILTAVVIGAGAIGIRKLLMNDYKVVDNIASNVKRSLKFKNWFAKNTDRLYEVTVGRLFKWVENYRMKHSKHENAGTNSPNANANNPNGANTANNDNK